MLVEGTMRSRLNHYPFCHRLSGAADLRTIDAKVILSLRVLHDIAVLHGCDVPLLKRDEHEKLNLVEGGYKPTWSSVVPLPCPVLTVWYMSSGTRNQQ